MKPRIRFDKALIKLAGEKKTEMKSISSAIDSLREKLESIMIKEIQEITKQLRDGFTETIEHLSTNNHHAKSMGQYPDISVDRIHLQSA